MRPDSDIDMLLARADGPDEAWDAQVDDLVGTVTAWTGNDLRPIVYTFTELDVPRGEPLLLAILESGIRNVWERSWFQRQVRRPESEVAPWALELAPPKCAAVGSLGPKDPPSRR